MTNNELLYFAAKACGYKYYVDTFGCSQIETAGYWNPLVEDASAFRLIVKLGLTVETTQNSVAAMDYDANFMIKEPLGDDPLAAARRVVVRAAAKLGEKL